MHEIELWACVDSDGQYECGTSAESARERFENEIGSLADVEGFRLVCLTVKVALPVPVELTGEAPLTGESKLLSVK